MVWGLSARLLQPRYNSYIREKLEVRADLIVAEMNEAIDGTIKGSVTANKLALRDGPATTYNYIAGYVKGDTVYIYFKVNGFYYVQTTDGKTGYMSAQYIKASATVPSGTAIPSGTTPKASATAGASATPSTAASAAPTL